MEDINLNETVHWEDWDSEVYCYGLLANDGDYISVIDFDEVDGELPPRVVLWPDNAVRVPCNDEGYLVKKAIEQGLYHVHEREEELSEGLRCIHFKDTSEDGYIAMLQNDTTDKAYTVYFPSYERQSVTVKPGGHFCFDFSRGWFTMLGNVDDCVVTVAEESKGEVWCS